jgi:S-disulfanyl-L-cysteine oxidoreductase SoxD
VNHRVPVLAIAVAATFAGLKACTTGVHVHAQSLAAQPSATRGREIYRARCAECHGNAMEGTIGPPLSGTDFLAGWSGRPLVDFVDKIQKTMPFNQTSALSREESADVTSYIIETNKLPAGLSTFPAARATDPRGGRGQAPEGNLAELMRAIAFPNANIIFNLQLKDPAAQKKRQPAASPFDYVEWGATVYPGWLAVDQATIALAETAPLLLTPGRRCQNGRPAPVDRADWKQYVAALVDVSRLAHKASQARNYEAFGGISEKLNDACANCHKVYRDKGGAEGSGAARCQ